MKRLLLSCALLVACAVTGFVAVRTGGAASGSSRPVSSRPARHADAALVHAFDQVDQNTPWTVARTLAPTWVPAGQSWENEGLKVYRGRFYVSAFDKSNDRGHLLVIDAHGRLIKDIPIVDGLRQHPGGIDVHGNYAYVPLAVDAPHTSADILRINIRTFAVHRLFAVNYDHVGGLTYDPATNLLIGQDWDSRTFYEWTLRGRKVAQWRNANDALGYQDCQYVVSQKLLCSGSPLGIQKVSGFALIDLADREHAILNAVPVPTERGGNANEILAAHAAHGVRLTDYDASPGPITEFTTVVRR